MNYRFAYSIGFHPWEDALSDPPFVEKFQSLMEREESQRGQPLGRALDVGTGSGIWGVELAKRGWQVTGVHFVQKALDRAGARAASAGVSVDFKRCDVTALDPAEIGTGYDLVLDTGTFHDFGPSDRSAMARGIDAIASPNASVYLLVWPRRRRPLIRGVDRAGIETAFSGWKITDTEPSYFKLPKPLELLLRPDEHWYRLKRVTR